MKPYTAELYKDKAREWRWRIKAGNGLTVADSAEGYKRKKDCVDQLQKICEQIASGKMRFEK